MKIQIFLTSKTAATATLTATLISTLVAAVISLGACSTLSPTPYTERGPDGFGFKVDSLESGVMVAKFSGNRDTSATKAYAFAALGAYDYCAKSNQLAQVNDPVDESKEVNYTQVYSTTNYYMTPRGHYVPYTTTGSYPATEKFPRFAAPFRCKAQRHSLSGSPRVQEIGRELVSPITKDFKGGVLLAFEKTADARGLQDDDLIVNVAGVRVEKASELFDAIDAAKVGAIEFRVIRAGGLTTAKSEISDITNQLRETEMKQINQLCTSIGIEIDMLAGSAGYQRAKEAVEKESGQKPTAAAKAESSMSEIEKFDLKTSKDLCRRLRELPILRAPK